MNNTSTSLKRFLANKNTVTILGTLFIVLIMWVGYNIRIDSVTNPERVPYAKETIQPRTKITKDMIGYMEVPIALIKGSENVLINESDILNHYTNVNTIIPKYSLFYDEAVIVENELVDLAVGKLADGEVLFNLPVSTETTYGNSLYPGNYLDIYFKSQDDSKKIQYGKLVSNVKILAVKDINGRNVFENSEEFRTPSMLIFAVPKSINLLLRKAVYLKDYNAELIPVPIKKSAAIANNPAKLESNYLASFINAKTVDVPDTEILTSTKTTTVEETS